MRGQSRRSGRGTPAPPMVAMLGLALAVVGLGAWTFRSLYGRGSDPDAIWSEAQADLRSDHIDRAEQAVARLGRLRAPTPLDRMLPRPARPGTRSAGRGPRRVARVPDDHYMAAQARLLAGQVEIRRDRFRFAEQACGRPSASTPGWCRPTAS